MKTKFNGILTLLLAFVVQFTFAQEKTISGTVVDETNMPLPGATVVIKGTTTGTSTDFDGKYSISANTGDVLVFSYVGYSEQNATIGAESTIDIALALDNSLETVVITALGIKRKPDEITSANQVVDSEELTQANNPDVVSGLSGKVSGLQINTVSNGVNSETSIVLRGMRSISGNNQALVVIDGIVSSAGHLKSIDPNQIASVNVIKGANGAALYGSEGANGVMIVTTKSGSGKDADRISVNIKSTVDFENVTFVPERQTRYGQGWDLGNGYENITYENGGWGAELDGQIVPVGLPQADGTHIMAPYTSLGSDNIKKFFETGTTFQNSVSLSAGNADGYFNLSAQKQNTEFVIPGDVLDKNAFLLKVGKKVNKWQLGANVSYTSTKTSEAGTGLYADLLQAPVNVPIEQFEHSGNEGHWNAYFFNPYWLRDNVRQELRSDRFNVGTNIVYNFNDNINVLLRPNFRSTTFNYLDYTNAYSDPASVVAISGYSGRSQSSSFRKYTQQFENFSNDIMVNLDYDLTEDVTFKANLGNNVSTSTITYNGVGGNDLVIPGLFNSTNVTLDTVTDANTTRPVTGTHLRETRDMGVFGQFDFGYKDFVFVNLAGRNDWSSRLDLTKNSFFYPSAGLSFVPTKAFPSIKGDIITSAKITASYVKVGSNGSIGAYDTFPTMNVGTGFPFGSGPSYINDPSITDPLLEPEFTSSNEFGINLDLLKSRVTIDASYYSFTTDNQIVRTTASSASGLSSNRVNLSETKGTGFEIDLGLTPVKNDNIEWNVRMSYATNSNEVVKVSDDSNEVSLGGFTGLASVFAIEGMEFPVIKGTAYERDPQGRVLIDQVSGNPIQTSELKVLGKSTPDYILGLNTTFKYKNLKLGTTLDYRTGHVFYSDTKANLAWSGHLVESAQGGRGAFIFPNSAIETSPGVYEANTSVPTGGTTAGSFITYYNSYRGIAENNVIDATALKVREISLSYSLGDKMLKNTPLTDLTIGVNARNVFTFLPAENRGYGDPEFGFSAGNAQGISTTNQYPPTRTYGFSVNLTF